MVLVFPIVPADPLMPAEPRKLLAPVVSDRTKERLRTAWLDFANDDREEPPLRRFAAARRRRGVGRGRLGGGRGAPHDGPGRFGRGAAAGFHAAIAGVTPATHRAGERPGAGAAP